LGELRTVGNGDMNIWSMLMTTMHRAKSSCKGFPLSVCARMATKLRGIITHARTKQSSVYNHKFGPAAAHSNSWQPEIASARAFACSLRSPAAPGPFARRKHRQEGSPRTPKSRPQRDHPTSYPAVGCTRRGGGTTCPPYARGLPGSIAGLSPAVAPPQPWQTAQP
jgi:hypothetical protein